MDVAVLPLGVGEDAGAVQPAGGATDRVETQDLDMLRALDRRTHGSHARPTSRPGAHVCRLRHLQGEADVPAWL